MDVIFRRATGIDLRGTFIPSAGEPEVVRIAQVIHAALFYLEAGAIAGAVASLTAIVLFALLAHVIKFLGIEQSGGDAANIILWGLIAAASFATLYTVFSLYFRLLAHPITGRILCAVGSLIWALPAGLAASIVLHVLPWGVRVLGIWIVYLAVAAPLYWLKRRILRA